MKLPKFFTTKVCLFCSKLKPVPSISVPLLQKQVTPEVDEWLCKHLVGDELERYQRGYVGDVDRYWQECVWRRYFPTIRGMPACKRRELTGVTMKLDGMHSAQFTNLKHLEAVFGNDVDAIQIGGYKVARVKRSVCGVEFVTFYLL